MADHVYDVTDADFASFVKQHPRVVVDAWAPWCAPCLKLEPILKEIAAQHGGKLVVAKLNADENPQTAMANGVMGLPTLVLFRDGRRVDQVTGLQPKAALEQRFRAAFGL